MATTMSSGTAGAPKIKSGDDDVEHTAGSVATSGRGRHRILRTAGDAGHPLTLVVIILSNQLDETRLLPFFVAYEARALAPNRTKETPSVSRFLRRHRTGGLLALAASASIASLAVAGPIGATLAPALNHLIIASGSQTAYTVVQQLDDLFDGSPGCTLVAPPGTAQPLNFGCVTPATSLTGGNTENPYNDVAIEEPPLGGRNGLLQLENLGTGRRTTAYIDYATGPRLPVASDPPGLNFVSYAKDALTWFHFTQVNGARTPSAFIRSLTPAQLADIWDGTYTKWAQILNPKTGKAYYAGTAPIRPYAANAGSGLLTLWNSDLGGSRLQLSDLDP